MPSRERQHCQRVSHVDDRANEGAPIDRGVFDEERLVDLHDVEREVAEVAQRRVAGAEVVDGQIDPESLERVELIVDACRCR